MKSGSWELIRTVSLTTFCTLLSSLPQSVLISSLHLLSWHWNHLTRCLFPTSFFDPRGGYPDIKALEIFIHCSLPPITYYLFFLYNCIHFFLSFLWHLYSILHYIIALFSPQSLLGDPETSILWDQYPWFCRPVKEGLSEVPAAYLVFLPRHSNIQVTWATNWLPGPPTPPARAAVNCPPTTTAVNIQKNCGPLKRIFRKSSGVTEINEDILYIYTVFIDVTYSCNYIL